ncbi:MAG: hypothetical protein EZS28_025445 [Streblomastix strix]|uniref:RRM domain-containing protein n=1 Tax=Streblomastix strix TaxID=222440 RepID=A0A5J4V943_9EUKA|nr:MAG: hypothetical protein EZS28_025445 [Streblomastix strix]
MITEILLELDNVMLVILLRNDQLLIQKVLETSGLFIRNDARSVTCNAIIYAFAAFNPIPNTIYVKHDHNYQKLGISYFQFRYDENASEAVQMMNGKMIEGEQNEIEYQKLDQRLTHPTYIKQKPQSKQIQLKKEEANLKFLFISNINPQTSLQTLELLLTPFCTINAFLFKYGQFNKHNYSLVKFQTEGDAINAFDHLDAKKVDQSIIHLHTIILRVDNLDEDTNEVALTNFIQSKLPNIYIRVILIYNNMNLPKSLGFRLINFDTINDAQQAINDLNIPKLHQNGNAFKLTWLQPNEQIHEKVQKMK